MNDTATRFREIGTEPQVRVNRLFFFVRPVDWMIGSRTR